MAQEAPRDKSANKMRNIKIDKLIVNISVGETGDRINRAAKVINQLTGQRPVTSKSRLTVRNFGIRRGEAIAVHTTVRGAKAYDILEKTLRVKDFELQVLFWFFINVSMIISLTPVTLDLVLLSILILKVWVMILALVSMVWIFM